MPRAPGGGGLHQAGTDRAFASAGQGAGRKMSRRQATRRWQGRAVLDALTSRGILIRSRSLRGVAEEAQWAHKDVSAALDAVAAAGRAIKVARLHPAPGRGL
jgi:tRNA-splicing ligase RtcB (3'-phosphate/5'-hydroxy nucleic acid ligase)